MEWKFVKAVGSDETMADRVDIKEVRAGKPVCKLGTSVRNSAGDIRLTGAATLFAIPLAKD